MKGILLLITSLLWGSQWLYAQDTSRAAQDQPNQIEFMHPEELYSFRGLDGKGFLKRKPLNIPQVPYHEKETGLVVLIFTIDPAGDVTEAYLEQGQEGFASQEMIQAAMQAVEQWKFNPLPPQVAQADEQVRVLIQFNYVGSGRLYSSEGNFIIEGLKHRFPTRMPAPNYAMQHEGVVTAEVTVDPSGEIAWVDRYYAERPGQPVNPHLGIITHQVIRDWAFTPLPAYLPQEQAQVRVICRYFHWPDTPHTAAHARRSVTQ